MSQHPVAKFRFKTWRNISNQSIKRISAMLKSLEDTAFPTPSQGCGWNHHVAENNSEKDTLFKVQFEVVKCTQFNSVSPTTAKAP